MMPMQAVCGRNWILLRQFLKRNRDRRSRSWLTGSSADVARSCTNHVRVWCVCSPTRRRKFFTELMNTATELFLRLFFFCVCSFFPFSFFNSHSVPCFSTLLTRFLSAYLYVCISAYIFVYLCTRTTVYLSIYLSSYLSIHPSIHPSISLASYLSIHLSIYLSTYIYTPISITVF